MDIPKTEYDLAGTEACLGCDKDVDISRLHFRVDTVSTNYDATGLPFDLKIRTVAKGVEPLSGKLGTAALCQACGRGEQHSYHCEGF
jgi:hypothetical protein